MSEYRAPVGLPKQGKAGARPQFAGTVCGVRVVESWWSGYWGWNLITLRLQVSDEGIWQIDVRRYRDEAIFDYRTEDDARHQLTRWLAEARGDWRRVDHPR